MEAVIFMGVQGSGKSSFYKERFFRTHVRINLDMLKTRHREGRFLRMCVETRQPFVVDNTPPIIGPYLLTAKADGTEFKPNPDDGKTYVKGAIKVATTIRLRSRFLRPGRSQISPNSTRSL